MPFRTLKDVGELFERQSTDTSKRLGYVRESYKNPEAWGSLRLGEEAITSFLMLSLLEQGCTIARFKQTSRRSESRFGNDFDLWLGSEHKGYFAFAIQAKKIHVGTGIYQNLNHKNPSRQRQIELLEDYAQRYDAAPFYCLYNHTDEAVESEHWHCCSGPGDLNELGCSVTPSINIHKAIGKRGGKNFSSIHKNTNTIPLKCLVSCPKVWVALEDMAQNAPGRAASKVSDLFDPSSCYHPSLPPSLRESRLITSANENERGGSLRYISADEYWGTEQSTDRFERGVRLPKFAAVIEIED